MKANCFFFTIYAKKHALLGHFSNFSDQASGGSYFSFLEIRCMCLCWIFFPFFSVTLKSYHSNFTSDVPPLRALMILVRFPFLSAAAGPESQTLRPLSVDEPSEVLQRLQLEAIGRVL